MTQEDWDKHEIERLNRGWWLHFWLHSWDGLAVVSVVAAIVIVSFIGCL